MRAPQPRPQPTPTRDRTAGLALALTWALLAGAAQGQDLEPRRWSHLPNGMNIFGIGLGHVDGDLSVDPTLQLTDATVDGHVKAVSYVRSFSLLGRAARVDLLIPQQQLTWEGNLAGSPASTQRTGFGDPRIRLSVNLVGAPALEGEEFRAFRQANPVHTVVGAGLAVTLPMGEYKSDKLINLGQNRYSIRPQVGVLHTRGPWSYELTASSFFFTRNRDFVNGGSLEQENLHACQAHVVRTLGGGWWVSAGSAYAWGGQNEVNGVDKGDRRADLLSGASFGFPIAANQSVKFAYIRQTTKRDIGQNRDTIFGAWSVRF